MNVFSLYTVESTEQGRENGMEWDGMGWDGMWMGHCCELIEDDHWILMFNMFKHALVRQSPLLPITCALHVTCCFLIFLLLLLLLFLSFIKIPENNNYNIYIYIFFYLS